MTDIDMAELEKKAWKSTHEDGFVDIVIGTLLVSFAHGKVAASTMLREG